MEVDFRLEGGEANLSMLASGSVAIKTEDGALCTATLEPISAVEIDISHTDVRPTISIRPVSLGKV